MATDIAKLRVVVNADTQDAEQGLNRLGGIVGKFGPAVLLGTGAAAAGIGLLGAKGVQSAGDLEQAVANISTIKPDIDTSVIFASLNELSTKIPQSASELGAGLYDIFSSMDVGQEEALQLVATFGKGATAAGTDAKTFGTAIMGVMNAYKLEVGDAAQVSDLFFNTINKGVITGEELAGSLGMVTGSAKAAGVELPDLMAMIAGVTKEGGPAAQNVNNLNNFLAKFTTTEAQKAMKGLGIATVDSTGKLRAPMEVLADLKTRLADLTEAERAAAMQDIFPDLQARTGANVLMSQLDMINEALETNQTTTGAASEAYKKMLATYNAQTKILGNTFQSILTTVGAEILPVLTPLVTMLAERLPAAFATLKGAVGPVLDTLGTFFGYFQENNTFDLMGSLFGPEIGPKIDEVVRAVQGIVSTVVDVLSALGSVLQGNLDLGRWFAVAGTKLAEAFGPYLSSLLDLIGTAIPLIVKKLAEWGKAFIDWIGPQIPPLLTELGKLSVQLLDWIAAEGPGIAKQLIKWAFAFVEWVAKEAIPKLIPELWKLANAVMNWIVLDAAPAFLKMAVKMGEAIVTGILDGLKGLAGQLVTALTTALKGLKVDVGPFHISASGFTMDMPAPASEAAQEVNAAALSERRRALGGPVLGGLSYLVGETGPELFTPSASGNIIPNNRLGGGMQPVNLTLNLGDEMVTAALLGSPDNVEKLARALGRYGQFQAERA